MATILGSFSGISSANIRPYIEYSFTQNQAGNYSDVTATLYFQRINGAYWGYNYVSNEVSSNIDGSTTYDANIGFDLSGGTYLVAIKSRTVRVYHNSDGTRTCWIGFSGNTNISWGTYNFGQTVTLTTIPREATVTNTPNFTIEDDIPLTINNPGNFYVKVKLYVNSVLIKTVNAGQVASYTIDTDTSENNSMYSQVPNATSISAFVRLQTYSDSGYTTQIGVDKDKSCTASVNTTTNKPTFTDYSVANLDKNVVVKDKYDNTLVTSSTETLTGSSTKVIKGYSKVRATISVANKAVALNSATMNKYKFIAGSLNAEENYSGIADVNIDIDNVLTKDFTVQAIDSRNLVTGVDKSLANLADYVNVSIYNLSLTRANDVDAITTLTFEGKYWKEYFGGGSSGVLNTITCQYRYKETTEAWGVQSWTTITPTSDGSGNLTFSDEINGDLGVSGFDTEKSFNIEVRIYDKLSQMIIEGTLNVGTPLLHYTKNGVAIKGRYNSDIGGKLQTAGGEVEPVGVIQLWGTNTAPVNWLICDGSAISRTTYARLFAVLGTTYGSGNGTTTFNIPNLKGKIPVGRDSGDTSFDNLAETGGAKTHALDITEIPKHRHSIPNYYPANHWNGGNVLGADAAGSLITSYTGYQGGDGSGNTVAHNNLQPYIVLNYIIKAL